MSSVTNVLRQLSVTAVIVGTCVACAPRAYDSPSAIGVLPPQPPTPIWLGSVRGSGSAPVTGAAAVTPSQTPGWSHVLISLGDVSSGGIYTWSLRSGSCGAQGTVIGPADRYGDFTIHADGSGSAEAVVPLVPTSSGSYAVVATPVSPSTATGACADLTRTFM